MKSEFLQLAHTFKPGKQNIGGWYASIKLDGERALWDGGISRGLPADQVPYANTVKDDRLLEQPIATGLWSRTGKVVYAPEWFLDQMPPYPLDGELYNGRKGFQELRKIVGRREADERWHLISYCVFDSPPWEVLFAPRSIKVRNEYEYRITELAQQFARDRKTVEGVKTDWPFEFVLKFLSKKDRFAGTNIVPVAQQRLPVGPSKAEVFAQELAREECDEGGEGVMLRSPISRWEAVRSHNLLKFKPHLDDEASIVGFVAGKAGKQGLLEGKIGAIIVDWQGTRFKIGSGMEHSIREFTDRHMTLWAINNPGVECPPDFNGKDLRIGDLVTFMYRECSDDGVPKEARFWRKRD